jgi:hypothetical protein
MEHMYSWDWHGKTVVSYRDLTEEELLFVKNFEGYKVPKGKRKIFRGKGAFDRACKWQSEVTNVGQ